MVRLASSGQVFWPIEPIYTQIYVGGVASANLKNSSKPVLEDAVVILLLRLRLDKDALTDFEFICFDCMECQNTVEGTTGITYL